MQKMIINIIEQLRELLAIFNARILQAFSQIPFWVSVGILAIFSAAVLGIIVPYIARIFFWWGAPAELILETKPLCKGRSLLELNWAVIYHFAHFFQEQGKISVIARQNFFGHC